MKKENMAFGVLLLIAGLVLVQIPVSLAADQGNQEVVACIQFTKNGQLLGKPDCTGKANDLHADYNGRGEVQFTLNGKDVGDVQRSPPSANDFHVHWNTTGQILHFHWTKDGTPIGVAIVPASANDFHFKVEKIDDAVWTSNGVPIIPPISVPKGANDLEWRIVEKG